MVERTLVETYKARILDYSHFNFEKEDWTKRLDTGLRLCIGKTDDIRIALCSHQAIINREFPEHFCRICNTDLSVGDKARWNDFLVLRHSQCTKPICNNCAENKPDEFHIAFRKGLNKFSKINEDEESLIWLLNGLKKIQLELKKEIEE